MAPPLEVDQQLAFDQSPPENPSHPLAAPTQYRFAAKAIEEEQNKKVRINPAKRVLRKVDMGRNKIVTHRNKKIFCSVFIFEFRL
ncbi:MAG: hypothetical protein A3G33_00775 [Omnitrophica bacterium RIFCSPLOWO2_12_FULL_44_17]|uniref:Uncharacterized protein n=1 Tax=Candidatus Danuiimicrobium aquiferis TaxID=1801832 RepID=A0A1G1L2V0_9BACT|nr:MAG: hypothetical protein A3E74_01500 [Omnitrophica bacterium RIFCSPHIGHO2_12_FULL_44_12]OGW99462.1 MAG: hypothetical protein A3G33_00775 [Omnitrophica bacterium RIFCSPLOWO2_12_FULL_44_17]OGX03975.1 MAG: hypothetical protein A3J12_04755 [Omnitrophica bacterium RIFCSPLOWO2_02_FULL_44_11]